MMAQEYLCKLRLAANSHFVGLPCPDPFIDGDYLLREVVPLSWDYFRVALLAPGFRCFTLPENWNNKGMWLSKKVLPPLSNKKWQSWWASVGCASELDEHFTPVEWLEQGMGMAFMSSK
jgi:hypothetical protein